MAKPVWSDIQVLDQLVEGSFWAGPTISYAFPDYQYQVQYGDKEKVGFSPLTMQQREILHLSMTSWNDLILPTISLGQIGHTQIEISNTTTGIEYAHAYFPDIGSIWFSQDASLLQPSFGGYGMYTYIHEVGHALGLDHMGDYNGEDDDGPSSYQDSVLYSVMSYYGPHNLRGEGEVAWGKWSDAEGNDYAPQTPMMNDIMAIQYLYGAATTRVENTVYGFGSNVTGPMAAVYDFTLNPYPVLTIYDSGGIDTLNLSGWGSDSHVDLRPGHFSSVNGMENNLSIARHVFIENVISGAGDDVIHVNSADNYIDGGAGHDTVLFTGDYEDYVLSYDPLNARYSAEDTDDVDGNSVLKNIETATFADHSDLLNNLTEGVHRFYNTENNTHFFTANNDEASIVGQYAGMLYEGAQFGRNITDSSNSTEVHRFYNPNTQAHFYTAEASEISGLINEEVGLQYEGLAYKAYDYKTELSTELYRFYNVETNSHFYTSDLVEKEQIEVSLAGQYQYEGVAFYVAMV